ncbi:MAG: hypothetical protein JWP44_540 [Mucilaginibacter sp.]|nr:hypothetical protein [Mucilaginibacter sp.]
MKKGYLIFVLILVTTLSYAQSDGSNLSLNTGPIQYKPAGVFRAEKFIINGERVNGKQVNALLLNYPASTDEFKAYKKNRHTALFAGGASVLFAVGIIAATGSGNSSSFTNTPSKVFFGLSVGSLLTEVVFGQKSYNQYKRSIGLYNQQFH